MAINDIWKAKRPRPKQEGVVAPWCDPLTLQTEQSDEVGSIPGKTPLLERHDKVCSISAISGLGAEQNATPLKGQNIGT